MNDTVKTWSYEGYWRTVLGDNDAATAVNDFVRGAMRDAEVRRNLDEWLDLAEHEAWSQGDKRHEDFPEEWHEYHAHALEELYDAATAAFENEKEGLVRTLTRDEIVDAVFHAVNETRETDLLDERSFDVLLGVACVLNAKIEDCDEEIARDAWWEQVSVRVSAIARLAYNATYDAMQSDDFDATADATEAAAAAVKRLVGTRTGTFDTETLRWTFDE